MRPNNLGPWRRQTLARLGIGGTILAYGEKGACGKKSFGTTVGCVRVSTRVAISRFAQPYSDVRRGEMNAAECTQNNEIHS